MNNWIPAYFKNGTRHFWVQDKEQKYTNISDVFEFKGSFFNIQKRQKKVLNLTQAKIGMFETYTTHCQNCFKVTLILCKSLKLDQDIFESFMKIKKKDFRRIIGKF